MIVGGAGANAETVDITLTQPVIQSGMYQKPFIAIWLEKPGERRAVETITLWYDGEKWLKDIRRWWRKTGRYEKNWDAMSGATRTPGTYQISWNPEKKLGEKFAPGEYTLYLEAVREHGNRTLLKQKIVLGKNQPQEFELAPGVELGPVTIVVGESK